MTRVLRKASQFAMRLKLDDKEISQVLTCIQDRALFSFKKEPANLNIYSGRLKFQKNRNLIVGLCLIYKFQELWPPGVFQPQVLQRDQIISLF